MDLCVPIIFRYQMFSKMSMGLMVELLYTETVGENHQCLNVWSCWNYYELPWCWHLQNDSVKVVPGCCKQLIVPIFQPILGVPVALSSARPWQRGPGFPRDPPLPQSPLSPTPQCRMWIFRSSKRGIQPGKSPDPAPNQPWILRCYYVLLINGIPPN